jgi:SAM-dependent methyltransferase
MQDLSRFDDGCFDVVFHPVSNVFVPDVRPVWREAARVLRPGGELLAGFANPALFMFDEADELRGELIVRHKIPYSDLDLPKERLDARIAAGEPLEFGHTLDDQIGGQLTAGLVLVGFYEDRHPPSPLAAHLPCFLATRARKPA